MKRVLSIASAGVATFALCFALVGCAGQQGQSSSDSNSTQTQNQTQSASTDAGATTAKDEVDYTTGIHHINLVLSGFEERPITIEVYSDSARKTVKKIISLMESGYYIDKPIFEMMKDMYVKIGNTTQDNDNLISGEYEESDVYNSNSLRRGTIAVARAEDGQQSDASSFIICLSDLSYLDGKYAGFGKVKEGYDVITEIVDHINVADDQWSIKTDEQGKVLNEDMPKIKVMEWAD